MFKLKTVLMEMTCYEVVVEYLRNMIKELQNNEKKKNKNKRYLIIEIYVNS